MAPMASCIGSTVIPSPEKLFRGSPTVATADAVGVRRRSMLGGSQWLVDPRPTDARVWQVGKRMRSLPGFGSDGRQGRMK
jgi:hypothetical protein